MKSLLAPNFTLSLFNTPLLISFLCSCSCCVPVRVRVLVVYAHKMDLLSSYGVNPGLSKEEFVRTLSLYPSPTLCSLRSILFDELRVRHPDLVPHDLQGQPLVSRRDSALIPVSNVLSHDVWTIFQSMGSKTILPRVIFKEVLFSYQMFGGVTQSLNTIYLNLSSLTPSKIYLLGLYPILNDHHSVQNYLHPVHTYLKSVTHQCHKVQLSQTILHEQERLNEHSDLTQGCGGVGIIWRRSLLANPIKKIVSDRFCVLELSLSPSQTSEPRTLNIIPVYLPSSDHSLEEYAEYLTELTSIVSAIECSGPVLLLGDFNAHLPLPGNSINQQGNLLLDFIQHHCGLLM